MKLGKCRCGKFTLLTRHSPTGNHQPPFDYMCRKCHDEEDGMNPPRQRVNKKYARGTKRMHKKGWRKK